MEELRTVVSALALVVSLFAIWMTRRYWLKANRPIVAAMVRSQAGNLATAYDLVVMNVGSRPAVDIHIDCDHEALNRALVDSERGKHVDYIRDCFGAEAIHPFLSHGESAKAAFGWIKGKKEESTWHFRSKIPIMIAYRDLEGGRYTSRQDLMILNSDSYANAAFHTFSKDKLS